MFLQKMDDRVSITRDWFKNYKFTLVQTMDQLKTLVDYCVAKKLCSLDLETTGLDNRVYPDEYFNDGRKTRHGIRTINHIAGVCIAFDEINGYYIPVGHEPEDSGNLPWDPAWDEITRLVQGCRVIFHNAKFDCEFLYPVTGKDFWGISEFEDTFLMAKVYSPLKQDPSGLKPLSNKHFSIDMIEIDELFTQERRDQLKKEKRGYNFAMMHPKEGLEYGCSDGIFTYRLYKLFTDRNFLSAGDMRIYNLEKNFCNVMREMERNRVHIDVQRVNELLVECQAALRETGDVIRTTIESKTGESGKWLTLNIGSVKQLSAALLTDQEGLGMKPTKEMLEAMSEGGFHESDADDDDEDDGPSDEVKQYSLKDEALKSLQRNYGDKFVTLRKKEVKDPSSGKMRLESIFDLILEYRHYEKMLGSYVEKLVLAVDKNGDVRPNFMPMGTDTARLSCKAGKIDDGYSGVNFQGIPRDSDEDKPELFKQIRTCIAPRPGWILVKLDYSGEELRVVTNLSGDPIWTKSFLHEDGDVHSITARTLFGKSEVNKDERNRGKRCNFAFIYGGGAGAIQRNIGCTIEDAQRHMNNLRNDVPVLMSYVDHQKKYAHSHKCIYTAFGRKIPIPSIDSPIRGIKAKAERCAINYTIQSTSADVIKFAMCYVDKKLREHGWKDKCRYILTVHDEVVFEIRPENLMEIVRKLDEWMTLPWRLPKAHGREWVVPLLTEPGIDIHWRARFDYFKMVDGTPVKPDNIQEDGTYAGKLKKDEYFVDGRVYQKIPDFLEEWIKRIPPADKILSADSPKELPVSVTNGHAHLPGDPAVKALPVEEKQAPSEPTPTAKAVAPVEPAPPAASSVVISADLSIGPSMDLDLGDLDTRISSVDLEKKTDANSVVIPKSKHESIIQNIANTPTDKVLRWTLHSELNKYNQRRLHAICILAEGDTALRIVTQSGEVLVSEDAGIKVHPIEFQLLTRVFGL